MPKTISALTFAAIAAAGVLLAPTGPAAAQRAYDSSAPRAGAPIDAEPLDPEPPRAGPQFGGPPPRYEPAPRGGYGAPAYPRRGVDDAYRPPRPIDRREDAAAYREPLPAPGYGAPYGAPREPYYEPAPHQRRERWDDEPPPADGTFSIREITAAGHGFFGSISQGLASVIEYAFKRQGRPNGYILGEDVGGAFVAGLRYGEGRLYTRDAGTHKVFWQGPSLGYDAGAEGSKVMVLVYNLRDPSEIYERFGGVAGSAYVVGGVGLTFQSNNHVVLAPIRAGIGLRIGANIGYLKYTRRPTWNPF
jgi:hypothetical protein